MPRIPFIFPEKGQDESINYPAQPPNTSSDCKNVRPYDPVLKRRRGGSRAGLSKFIPNTVNGTTRVQQMVKAIMALPAADIEAAEVLLETGNNGNAYASGLSTVDGTVQVELDDVGVITNITMFVKDLIGNYYGSGAHTGGNLFKYNDSKVEQWSVGSQGTGDPWVIGFNEVYQTIIAVDDTDEKVYSYDTADGGATAAFTTNYDVGGPSKDIKIGPDGHIFVLTGTNPSKKFLFKLNGRTGALMASWGTDQLPFPSSQIFIHPITYQVVIGFRDPANSYDQGDTPANVFVFDSDLTLELAFRSPDVDSSFSESKAISVIDSDGNIYVLMLNGYIVKHNSAGVYQSHERILPVAFAGLPISSGGITEDDELVVCALRRTDYTGQGGSNTTVLCYNGTTVASGVKWSYDGATDSNSRLIVDRGRPETLATRRARLAAVAAGDVYLIEGLAAYPTTTGDDVLTTDLFKIVGVSAYGKVYFVDGTNEVVLDLATDTCSTWAPGDEFPANPRLITRWRGRMVVAGMIADPALWVMSAVGDPDDWDTAPATTTAIMAMAGNVGEVGLAGDIITALCPFDDDLLIIGMDSSIGMMAGDPAAGGSIDIISSETGIAWDAWAIDPNNTLYFMGIDGIYTLERGSRTPIPITQDRLDVKFEAIDLKTKRVKLAWDYLRRGLQVVIVDEASGEINEAWFWEQRTDGWFPDEFPVAMGPDVMLAYDAEGAEDKALLFGCRDGFIRRVDATATDDDGTAIASNVRFLPIGTRRGTDSRLYGLEVVLAENSEDVTVKVRTGQTAEQCAISTEVRWSRVCKAGRNMLTLPRVNGAWLQLEFSSTGRWALESVYGLYTEGGRARQVRR